MTNGCADGPKNLGSRWNRLGQVSNSLAWPKFENVLVSKFQFVVYLGFGIIILGQKFYWKMVTDDIIAFQLKVKFLKLIIAFQFRLKFFLNLLVLSLGCFCLLSLIIN